MLSPGDRAPDAELQTPAGAPERLSTHWRDRPLALFFERHVGCCMCREHVTYLRGDYAKFQEAGGNVLVVTQGPPEAARRFAEKHALPFPVLADRDRAAYRAFSLPRGTLWQLIGPATWWPGFKAMLRRGVATPQGGDVTQMPGAFVIDRHGAIRLAHYFANSADWPPNEQIFAAVRQAAKPYPLP